MSIKPGMKHKPVNFYDNKIKKKELLKINTNSKYDHTAHDPADQYLLTRFRSVASFYFYFQKIKMSATTPKMKLE